MSGFLASAPSAQRQAGGLAAAMLLLGLGLCMLLTPGLARAEAGDGAACAGPNGSATACYDHGVVLERAGRYDAAIADFTAAIALRPGFLDAFASRGVAYDQKGLYDRAIADYTRAITAADPARAASPTFAETYFNRGAAYEHRRLYRQAAADYRAALKLDPNLQPAQEGLKRLDGRP